MAEYKMATSDGLRLTVVSEKLYRDTAKESYFTRFMGTGPSSMIQSNEQLGKGKGDRITFGIRMRLSGSGVTGTSGDAVEGHEEDLTLYNFNVTLEEYAHAVKYENRLSPTRAPFDLTEESKDGLKTWGAEKIDDLIFDALQASLTRTMRPNSRATKSVLTATDLMDPNTIARVRAGAKTGWARTQTPLRPIKVDGREYYVMLVHPDVMYDMYRNSEFNQALREAEIRGKDNPLFTGAKAIWQNVVIHEHENVAIGSNAGAGSNVNYADCLFLGAQAGVFAWGDRPKIVSETFDFQRKRGDSWQMICAAGKPVFNSKDYGVVGVQVARTDVSGATN